MKYKIEFEFFIDEDENERHCTEKELYDILREELSGACCSVSKVKLLEVKIGEDD